MVLGWGVRRWVEKRSLATLFYLECPLICYDDDSGEEECGKDTYLIEWIWLRFVRVPSKFFLKRNLATPNIRKRV